MGKSDKHKRGFYIQNRTIWIMTGDKMKVSCKFIDVSYFPTCQQFILSLSPFVMNNILKFQNSSTYNIGTKHGHY